MRLFLVTVLCLACIGCSRGTPASVTALFEEMERNIAADAVADHAKAEFFIAAYETAVREHVETIMDYEITLAGDTIAVDRVRELLTQYRAKHADIRANVAAMKVEMARGEVVQARLREITAKLGQYLAAQRDETEELRKALVGLREDK